MALPIIPNGYPAYLIHRADSKPFSRFRVQTLTLASQLIVDGFGFNSVWREAAIATLEHRYAEFTVPAGFYMAIDSRDLQSSAPYLRYRVYAGGTYTLGTDKTDDADNFLRTRNLRQDSLFTGQFGRRVNVTVAPTVAPVVDEDIFGGGAGGNAIGALNNESSFLLLSPGQSFLLDIYNGHGQAGDGRVELLYGLVPASAVAPSLAPAVS